MENLFKVLQTIIRCYSRLPLQKLFENHLVLNIFVFNNLDIAKEVLREKFPTIKKAKEYIFLKGDSNLISHNSEFTSRKQKSTFIYLTLNHPKLPPLHKTLLEKKLSEHQLSNFVENLICLTLKNQVLDNILEIEEKPTKELEMSESKAFFFKIYEEKGVAEIINQLSLFLSIYEFYHSHTGLVLSLHDINCYQTFEELLKLCENEFAEDDDELLTCSQYCRLFQALPYKITNEDIALLSDIETDYWGEKIRIEQGNDGLLFWFLFDKLPLLENPYKSYHEQDSFQHITIPSSQKSLIEKSGMKISEEKFSYILLKSKSLRKEPLENLCLTIVILNVKKMKYCNNLNQIFNTVFEKEIKKLCHNRAEEKEFEICEKSSEEINRLSELLANIYPQNPSFEHQKHEMSQEAEELAYNINRWLYLKCKD